MSDPIGLVHGANPCQQLKEPNCEDGESEWWDIRNSGEPLFKKAQYARILTNKAGNEE